MADLLSLASQLRASVERQDDAEASRLVHAYQSMTNRLEGSIDALSRDIEPGVDVEELESYQRLMTDVDRELTSYSDYLTNELTTLALLWLTLGVTNSTLLIQQAGNDNGINIEPVEFDDLLLQQLNDYLIPGGALYNRLQEFVSVNVERVRSLILESVTLGLNPRELARIIVTEGLGMGLTDALRMARTLELYAYRDATLANYNQYDVIKGWVWMSALIPGRTCMSCVNMHGTIHGLDETLNDHHGGLCAMLPYMGGRNPITQSGEDWFNNQDPGTQVKMMGLAKFDAWQQGRFTLSEVTGVHNDPVYGDMRYERSLKDILGA